MAGVPVRGLFEARRSVDNKVESAVTDTNGLARISGRSWFAVSVTAEKDGYYYSNEKVITFERIDRKNVYSDQDVEFVLCRKINPIPMFAKRVQVQIQRLGKPIGFDLMKGDWVAPHGVGETADVFLKVSGRWQGFRNHDSVLTLTFPNRKDGIRSFKARGKSQFKSPHEAPLSGYAPKKSWRKSNKPVEGDRYRYETVANETAHDANYTLRVRTVLDDKGKIKSAHYGKIYGDFEFGGATLDDSGHGVILFTYYLNPTESDRNLEFDPERNLFLERRGESRPREP